MHTKRFKQTFVAASLRDVDEREEFPARFATMEESWIHRYDVEIKMQRKSENMATHRHQRIQGNGQVISSEWFVQLRVLIMLI